MGIKSGLYLIVLIYAELILNKMLTNVTSGIKNRQFIEFTCFSIYVGSIFVEAKIHA